MFKINKLHIQFIDRCSKLSAREKISVTSPSRNSTTAASCGTAPAPPTSPALFHKVNDEIAHIFGEIIVVSNKKN